MAYTVGIDVVHIPKFERTIQKGKEMVERMFSPEELKVFGTVESLAGAFAAKEAVMKAVSPLRLATRDIGIIKNKENRPSAVCNALRGTHTLDVSISHDGEYAVAVCIAEKR